MLPTSAKTNEQQLIAADRKLLNKKNICSGDNKEIAQADTIIIESDSTRSVTTVCLCE